MKKYSEKFGEWYDTVMNIPEEIFLKSHRKNLLSGVSGKVLEVGIGTGANLPFYEADVALIGIEPSPYMLSKAEKQKQKIPHPHRFTLHNVTYEEAEQQHLISPESLDAIVCTLVLCTIPEPEKAITVFLKWLKPHGRLLVLEHIKSHRRAGAIAQNLINPLWKKLAEGCQLNRPTDVLLANSALEPVHEEYFWLGMPFYKAEFRKPEMEDKQVGSPVK